MTSEATEYADDGSPPSISATFVLGGPEFDAHAFTAAIGIEPTEIWHQRHPELRNRPDFPECEWRYAIRRQPRWSTSDAVQPLLDMFSPMRKQITTFAQQHGLHVSINCYVQIENERPIIELTREQVAQLADMDAAFGVDLEV